MSQRKPFDQKNFLESQAYAHDDGFAFAQLSLAKMEAEEKPKVAPAKVAKPAVSLNLFKAFEKSATTWKNMGLGFDPSHYSKKTPSKK